MDDRSSEDAPGPTGDDVGAAAGSDADGDSPSTLSPWWGPFDLDTESTGRWDVGPLTLWIHRAPHEWTVTTVESGDPLLARSEATVPDPDASPPSGDDPEVAVTRYATRPEVRGLRLQPALPDRPVVVRPEQPLVVPPAESMRMYTSMPLWVVVETLPRESRSRSRARPRAGEDVRPLHEQPSHRPSDTWFGPSTREGTLCYALRTTAQTEASRLPRRLHRAVTPIQIENRADEALPVERIQVPAPHLTLYETPDHGLWTPAIDFVHETHGEGASVNVRPGVPPEAEGATELRPPREQDATGLATSTFRALGALFGS